MTREEFDILARDPRALQAWLDKRAADQKAAEAEVEDIDAAPSEYGSMWTNFPVGKGI